MTDIPKAADGVMGGNVRMARTGQMVLGGYTGRVAYERADDVAELAYLGRMIPAAGTVGTIDGAEIMVLKGKRSPINTNMLIVTVEFR